MSTITSLAGRIAPRVTFSAIVESLTSPAHRLHSILHTQKYPKPGPVFGYKKATEQLVAWIVNGTPINPNLRSLRPHEVDLLRTAAGVPGAPKSFLPHGAVAATLPVAQPTWKVSGVEISFFPDLLISGVVGKRKKNVTGALKFYLRKDPITVGPMLAALLYFHRSQIVKEPNVTPDLCAVVDVQANAIYTATGSNQRLLTQVENSCSVIAAIWPTI